MPGRIENCKKATPAAIETITNSTAMRAAYQVPSAVWRRRIFSIAYLEAKSDRKEKVKTGRAIINPAPF